MSSMAAFAYCKFRREAGDALQLFFGLEVSGVDDLYAIENQVGVCLHVCERFAGACVRNFDGGEGFGFALAPLV